MTTPPQDDTGRGPQWTSDDVAIRALYKRLLDAWEQGRRDAFTAPFSADADFVAFDGSVLRSPAVVTSGAVDR